MKFPRRRQEGRCGLAFDLARLWRVLLLVLAASVDATTTGVTILTEEVQTTTNATARLHTDAPLLATPRRLSDLSETDLVCQWHINRILPSDGRVHGDLDREFSTCSPWIAALKGTQGVYRVEVPAKIMEKHRSDVLLGIPVFLVVHDGSTSGDQIIIPSPKDVTVMVDTPSSRKNRQLQGQRGAKKTVMLRIRGYDSQPDFSIPELRQYLVTDNLSARRQLERCSQGLVTLDTSRYGVLDVPIESNIEGLTNMEVMNLAETRVNDVILASDPQVDSIRDWADFLIFVIPPGTGGWAAFATVSGKQSVFNNRWGGYLGALLHEMGHNMGLDHAYEEGVEYDGITGYMGNVPTEVLTPQRCYNAHNHFKLQWFRDRYLEVDPEFPQVVTLAPFVEYESAAPNEYIVVRVGNLFMQYNRAVSYNADSGEYPDTLVIVRERDNRQGTDLLVGLDQGEDYRENDGNERITVHVCSRQSRGGEFGADILRVSVGYGGSLCNVRAPTPAIPGRTETSAPTVSAPTSAPSARQVPTPQTMAPTIIVGDSLDNGGLGGIQQQKASNKDGSGLIGILAAALCFVAAVVIILIIYRKCCRASKVPPKSPSIHKEKETDDDTEKGSVHSGDSNSTTSSDDSFETEFAISPSRANSSIGGRQTRARSLAQSIATSWALAGTVAGADDEENDAELAVSNHRRRRERVDDDEDQTTHTAASMLASAKLKAATMISSTRVQAPPTRGYRQAVNQAPSQIERSEGDGKGSLVDRDKDASWLERLKISSWIPADFSIGTPPSCDLLNNMCGYGTTRVSTDVSLKRKSENGVVL